jgi:hypothetical protein
MPRFKDVQWNLPVGESGKILTWEALHVAVLMDIRDELKDLNRLLRCPNFTRMPQDLREIGRKVKTIDKRLAKRVKLP